MRNIKQKIVDSVLHRAENKAHYSTRDLSIVGFDNNYDVNDPHDAILLKQQMSFYNQRYDFLEKHIAGHSKILEIGDVNGFNIEHFGNDQSLSVNFVDFSNNIKGRFMIMNANDGIDIDETFDYGMMFETLEHLHNPILVLNQMLGICKKGVFVSVPYVRKAVVKLNLDGGHVFELSPNDYKKIFDYYGITIVDYNRCNTLKLDILSKPFKLHSMLHGAPDELFGIFESFQLYYLKKNV
ncbi:hypothetical protein [Methanolobus psychrotolerans]|uniref:hypothetical protein n=1 Tax=Methanolobus psychrotolerans TaxID=1874706 RepID=UPI000B91564E|nr:hypothetical protein [Methanolobus psychrotolerans]